MPTSVSACGVAQRVRFVEHCHVVRATAALFRAARRGFHTFVGGDPEDAVLLVTWPDRSQTRLTVSVVATAARPPGVRYWVLCPDCARRVGCLYTPSQPDAFRCRTCWGLRYFSQYRYRPTS